MSARHVFGVVGIGLIMGALRGAAGFPGPAQVWSGRYAGLAWG